MGRDFIHSNDNEQKNEKRPDSPKTAPEDNLALNLKEQETTAKDLEKSFLSDLNSQIELENEIIEEAAKKPGNNLRQSLLEVRKSGEEFLKNISRTTVRMFNSTSLVVKLRDSYIGTRGRKINQELSVDNKLAKSEDYDSFIKMLQSDFWGKSKNAKDAVFYADRALETIIKRFPEKTDEAMNAWPELFNKKIHGISFQGFRGYLEGSQGNFNSLSENKDRIKFIENSNDLVALKYLSDYRFGQKDPYVKSETIKRLDSIIGKHPNLEALPQDIGKNLLLFAGENPDQILDDSRRVNFIFKLWKSEFKNNPGREVISFTVPVIAERLKTCDQEESKELIELIREASYVSRDLNWLLSMIPLEKGHIKELDKAPKDGITDLNKARALHKELKPDQLYSLLLENSECPSLRILNH